MPGHLTTLQNLALQVQGIEEKILRLQSEDTPTRGTLDLVDTTAGPEEIAMAIHPTRPTASWA